MLKQSFLLLTAMLMVATAAMAQSDIELFLEQYQWQNRVVLVFAPGNSNPLYRDQVQEFKGYEDGFADRDLITFHLFSGMESFQGNKKLNKNLSDQFYQYYDVRKGEFIVLLIGKDGNEKLRQSKPLATDTLFSVIDAMPMRQREMRNKN